MLRAILVCALFVVLVLPASAAADEGDDVRVTGRCTGPSDASLRLQREDGSIRVELEIETRARVAPWRVILVHERRITLRKSLRTGASNRRLRLRTTVPDWFGADTIVVRATGPRRESCRATATI
jgi:hypothetical protein